MIITYNGEPLTTNAPTVFDLVMDQFGTEAGVAVALNRSIVPRSTWLDVPLRDTHRQKEQPFSVFFLNRAHRSAPHQPADPVI